RNPRARLFFLELQLRMRVNAVTEFDQRVGVLVDSRTGGRFGIHYGHNMRDADGAISALAANPDRTVLLVDFDGSLSPIVEQADAARPPPEAVDVLKALTASLGRVAVVSGRPVEFLATHLSVPGLVLVGLYGMQRQIDGHATIDVRVEP